MSGSHDIIVSHLETHHSDYVVTSEAQGYTDSFRLEQHSMYNHVFDRKILLAYDHIFRWVYTNFLSIITVFFIT